MAAVRVAGRRRQPGGPDDTGRWWVAYVGAPLHDEDGNVVGAIEELYVETGDHGFSVKR